MLRCLIMIVSLLMILSCNRTANDASLVAEPSLSVRSSDLATSPRNVIFLIGDGMGVAQIASGMYSQRGLLHIEQIPDVVIGLHKNSSADDLITDSAAGATAFSCGQKTYNGAIAVDIDTVPMKTIMEEAMQRGYRSGLVATSTITHATPASFVAHDKYRKDQESIAADMAASGVDVMIGGGSKYFNERTDEVDLYEQMRLNGYYVSDYFSQDFHPDIFRGRDKVAYLTARDSPLMASQGRSYLESAAKATVHHLDTLAAGGGFMLMIEGSQIDWGGHANNADYIISEMLEFDKVIGYITSWAEQNGETLVVITADHETGGFSINKGSIRADSLVTGFTSDYHTASLIPVLAMGPGSERFAGIYENTEIYHRIKAALGWSQ